MKLVLSVCLLALGTGSAIAQTPGTAATAGVVPVGKSAASEKTICHTEDTIGTRLGGHKECHTKSEWQAIALENRRTFEQSNRQLGSSSH